MFILTKSNRKASSRSQIDIEAVQEDILCLSGPRYCLFMQASSINFELKSEAEQDVLIETYQNFLNSLGSPIQILLKVRELDIDKYLDDFRAKRTQERLKVYKDQITSYTDFVRRLVRQNKILSRQFCIVLSYRPTEANEDFNVARDQLYLNADIVEKGLARLGMRLSRLTSLEILETFYSFFNVDQVKTQPITDQTMKLLKEANL